jgi:hypothetical protein
MTARIELASLLSRLTLTPSQDLNASLYPHELDDAFSSCTRLTHAFDRIPFVSRDLGRQDIQMVFEKLAKLKYPNTHVSFNNIELTNDCGS